MKFMISFLIIFYSLLSLAGTATLPQLTTSDRVITRDMFNDTRQAMYGEWVCRNASGVATDASCSLGTSTYGWTNLYFTNTTNEVRLYESSGDLFFNVGGASSEYQFKINGTTVLTVDNDGIDRDDLEGINYAISSSSGAYGSTSSTYVQPTNLSASITTTGNPVEISLVASATAASESKIECNRTGSCELDIQLYDGSSSLYEYTYNRGGTSGAGSAPCSIVKFIDVPSAGSKTYSVRFKQASSGSWRVDYCRLMVRELK